LKAKGAAPGEGPRRYDQTSLRLTSDDAALKTVSNAHTRCG